LVSPYRSAHEGIISSRLLTVQAHHVTRADDGDVNRIAVDRGVLPHQLSPGRRLRGRANSGAESNGLRHADHTNLVVPDPEVRLDLTEAFAAID